MCYHHHRAAAAACFRKRVSDKSRDSEHAYSSPGPYRPVLRTATVCFFVLCYRHWFNRVPGSSLGIVCLPSALTLTLADLPLTLLGAPVGIGETRVTVSRSTRPRTWGLPSRDRTACGRSAYKYMKRNTGGSPRRQKMYIKQQHGL
jgi:hypothetical protein